MIDQLILYLVLLVSIVLFHWNKFYYTKNNATIIEGLIIVIMIA
jgi:hypothetical protein